METNPPISRIQIGVVASLILIVLPLCTYIYGQRFTNYEYTAPAINKAQIQITNPLTLQNWLPSSSYSYTVARLRDNASTQNNITASITVLGDVQIANGSYLFSVQYNPSKQQHNITVNVLNFGGILSSTVFVDGQQQAVNTGNTNQGTVFDGTSTLIDQGVSSYQVNSLQTAFKMYKSSVQQVSIDTANITLIPPASGDLSARAGYSFPVTVDGQHLTAHMACIDSSSIDLTLIDSNGTQVFDSHTVNSAS